MKNKNVIYTVIIGDYDNLVDPEVVTPGWDYICFTDTDKKSDVWEVRKIELDPNLSNRKNARKIKILYHHFVGEYDTTIYVPGYSLIQIDLNLVANLLEPSYNIVSLNHPRRKCIYDEADTMIAYTGDPGGKIKKQINYYKEQGMPVKFSLAACGILVRKGEDKAARKHCELWWEEIVRYSPRDQISFMYIYWKYNLISLRKWRFRNFNKFFQGKNHHIKNKEYIQKHAAD